MWALNKLRKRSNADDGSGCNTLDNFMGGIDANQRADRLTADQADDL
jgi:hypothetical protein